MKCSERQLNRQAVLFHPLFLCALCLLALNDHVLKGAGVLPGWFTGKLSDFVGPIVAVCLVGAVSKVSTRRGLAVVALLVALPFCAINISTLAASWWSAAMSWVGFPWQVVTDPTDLLGLALLPVGLWILWKASAPTGKTRETWSFPQFAVATAAALACVATSPPVDPFENFLFTEVGILNNTPDEITVRVRTLNENVALDCFQVAQDPQAHLSDAVFDEGITWLIPSKEQVPADEAQRPCHAVILEIDGLQPTMLFWGDELFDIERPIPLPRRQNPGPQTISVERDGSGGLEAIDAGEDGLIVGPPTSVFPSPVGACAVPGPGFALTWSEPIPLGNVILREASVGPDECVTMTVLDPLEVAQTWTLCMPGGQFPFDDGDRLNISRVTNHNGGFSDAINLERIDEGKLPLNMRVFVGQTPPNTIFGLVLEPSSVETCEGDIDECGTYRRAGQIEVISPGLENTFGASGDHLIVEKPASRVDIFVGRVAERVVLNAECETRSPNLGMELEMTLIEASIEE